MELFKDCESYRMKSVVQDSRRFIEKNNPILPDETEDEYKERIFWLVNDEIERRILISGKKRPDYSKENVVFKKSRSAEIMHKNIKKYLDILK
ncbi:MAG: hypothetical protein UE295_06535 [Acutalibacteraceae bacterium]|nr:hypothetical protein [Acutalibacteraceae bacterium]